MATRTGKGDIIVPHTEDNNEVHFNMQRYYRGIWSTSFFMLTVYPLR